MAKAFELLGTSEFDILENASVYQPTTNSSLLTSYGRGRGRNQGVPNESKNWNAMGVSTVVSNAEISQRPGPVSPWVMEINANLVQRKGKGRGQKIYESCVPRNPQFDAANAAKISRQIEQVVGISHRNYTIESEYLQKWSPKKSTDKDMNDSFQTASTDESFSSAVEDLTESVASSFDKDFPALC